MSSELVQLIDRLEQEHAAVREALGALGALAEAGDAAELRSALPARAAVLGAGLDDHSLTEDATLFPAIADAVGPDLVGVFAAEHVEILALRDELYGGGDDVTAPCLGLCALLESHMEREELVLFPSARDLLDERS